MNKSEFRKNFERNINYFLDLNNMNQVELADKLGVSGATVSDWCTGKKAPRADKLEEIAYALGIDLSDLIGDISNKPNHYYINAETREMANLIFHDSDLRLLFDAARDATPEGLQLAHDMLLALKKKERGDED